MLKPEPYDVEVLQDWSQLPNIQQQWDALVVQSAADTIFLRWAWIDAWQQAVGRRVSPYIILIRNSHGELKGIVPFYRQDYRLLGVQKVRGLCYIGDKISGGEYPDIICRTEDFNEVLGSLSEHLNNTSWDMIWLPNIHGGTGAEMRWQALASSLGALRQQRLRLFSQIPLPDAFDTYFENISRGHAKQVKRQIRKLEESHRLQVECVSSEKQLEELMDVFFSLHGARWRAAGSSGTFDRKPSQRQFYRYFLPLALRQGWLRFYTLRADEQVCAIQVGFVYAGHFLQLQEGFDPQGLPGLGNYLRYHVIKSCIAEKLQTYDFLAGFTNHKQRWGAQCLEGLDMIICNRRSWKTPLLKLARIWPTGRFMRESKPLT